MPVMAAPRVAPRAAPAAPLVDTHAHLSDRRFARDLPDVLARAAASGVGACVVVGYDLDSSRAAVHLAHQHEGLWAAVGIHPHHANSVDGRSLAALRELAALPKVVALGECGLDFYRNLSPPDAQRRAFWAQLDLAAELDLPVVVHSRNAMAETLATLEGRTPPVHGVLHCFDGDRAAAARAAALGLYLSCAGPLTYRRDPTLAEALAAAPLGRLVLETDCPYLSPAGHRGERNEPAHVRLVAEALARLRREPLAAVARRTTENAAALFRTPALARAVDAGEAVEVVEDDAA
jgi:TatD DNase family protein